MIFVVAWIIVAGIGIHRKMSYVISIGGGFMAALFVYFGAALVKDYERSVEVENATPSADSRPAGTEEKCRIVSTELANYAGVLNKNAFFDQCMERAGRGMEPESMLDAFSR